MDIDCALSNDPKQLQYTCCFSLLFFHYPHCILGSLKARYIKRYQKHPIHIANWNHRIELEEINIDEFAVKLKICYDSPPENTFRDEATRYFESLTCVKGEDIELSQLVSKKNRVTFVRGIAGIGKSVLSKQVICSWARDSNYTDYTFCIFFECRDINYFKATKGAKFKTYELLDEFIKETFKFDLGDGEGVLFVIDGLDELYDINSNDSIIKQLLCRKIYPSSRVIATGRPHIESKLNAYGEIGGIRKVEIQGLDDKQIEEYAGKFTSSLGVTVDLNNAKDSSGRYLPIIHIPQFLNTVCCVSSLLKGKPIRNAAELYSWTVYLLLTQHGYKLDASETKFVSKVFGHYSEDLLVLCQVCYTLRNENKIIMLKKDIVSQFPDYEKWKGFFNSFFLDVPDNFKERLQFKHLTLIEFFSALHICSSENPIEFIEENLKKGFLEPVIFTCQLVSGFRYDGVIKELLKAMAMKLEKFDGKAFCIKALTLLHESRLDEYVLLSTSLDIILLFLSKDDAGRDFALLETVKVLQIKDLKLNEENSRKLCEIIGHLLYNCHCNEIELQQAFQQINVVLFHVNEVNHITHEKYFAHVSTTVLHGMKLSVNAARHEFEKLDYGKCERVLIKDCKLEDEEIEFGSSNSKLSNMVIMDCTLQNVKSLINAFNWATSSPLSSCKIIELFQLEIEGAWWSDLVAVIEEEKKAHKYTRLEELYIDDCTTNMSTDLQLRVRRNEVSHF